jgi:phosphoribosylformylglycinamidine cyclo-ligase
MKSLSYDQSGVNYDRLDAFKRACQQGAAATVGALEALGLREPANIRGESAYLIELPDRYLAHVEEGLGTNNLVADAMQKLIGRSFYHGIGIDTVATIVNDLVTSGAAPLSVAMHAGVGDSEWFADEQRAGDLAAGFAEGCRLSGAVWGGGETPALAGIIREDGIVLAGSAIGQIYPKSHRIPGDPREGDAIILLASSGVQTNGLSLCRKLAERLPEGYLTRMEDGRSYGEALLDPSVIYARYIAAIQAADLHPHYTAHITGHGWRKLMRATESFVYRIDDVGMVPEIFRFIMKQGPVETKEAYATFNMGAGFAVYVSPEEAPACLQIARKTGYRAWQAGTVLKEADRKAVEIGPLGITFEGESLQVR